MPSLRALARQSIAARLRKLDCFVAFAPRNDDQTHLLLSAPRSLFLIPPPSWGGWHIVSATSDVSGGGVSTSRKRPPPGASRHPPHASRRRDKNTPPRSRRTICARFAECRAI